MDKFAPLRAMESFSEDMFNRIFEFQQRLHPAWNPDLPFAERIRGLPLHYLVFSNGDRDPKQYGPTVAPYYPLREEMRKIAYYARAVTKQPLIADLHGGNGFVGSLLAREGVRVISLRDPAAKPNQILDFRDPTCTELHNGSVQTIDFPFDVAFSSWMPPGINLTPAILRHEPKLIVYVHTDHIDASSDRPQTGAPEAFSELPTRYRLLDHWSITRPADLFHDIWPDLSGNIAETRHVKIFADLPFQDIPPYTETVPDACYDWEGELTMILLAREAKAHLHTLGYRL